MMPSKDFSTRTTGNFWGGRDKIVPVDTALKNYWKDKDKGLLTDVFLLEPRIIDILTACKTYMADATRGDKSKRNPGVIELRRAAEKDLEDLYGSDDYVAQLKAKRLLNRVAYDGMAPIHRAVQRRQKEKVRKLVADGTRPDVRSRDGNTALGLSALGQNEEMARLMLELGAGPSAPALLNLKPIDLACTKQSAAVERLLLENGGTGRMKKEIPLPSPPRVKVAVAPLLPGVAPIAKVKHAQRTPVEILKDASAVGTSRYPDGDPFKCPGPDRVPLAAWEHLWAVEQLRPILSLAALEALGPRAGGRGALRIFFVHDKAINRVAAQAAGLYETLNNTLTVGGKNSQASMEGTLIHELTHHAEFLVYANGGPPYFAGNDNGYLAALDADLSANVAMYDDYKRNASADDVDAADEDGAAYTTLLARLEGYSNEPGARIGRFSKGQVREALVGVPQCLHQYGGAYSTRHAPQLTAYFENVFLPEVEKFVIAHRYYDQLKKPALSAAGVAATTATSPTARREIHVQLLWKDPAGRERPFPAGLQATALAGSRRSKVTRADGKFSFHAAQEEVAFELSTAEPTWIGIANDAAAPELIKQPALQAKMDAGCRVFRLPPLFGTRDGTWAAVGATLDARSGRYKIAAGQGTTADAPVKLTVDPRWQYLQLRYFDRKLGRTLPLPPVALEGFAQPDLTKQDAHSNWTVGTADDRVQCLPWMGQAKSAPDAECMVRFTTQPGTFIHTTAGGRALVVLDGGQQDTHTRRPGPLRLDYYDLPLEWRWKNFLARPTGSKAAFIDDLAQAALVGSLAQPLGFSLDDVVLLDETGKLVDFDEGIRFALFSHTFAGGAGLSDVGVHKPDAAAPWFSAVQRSVPKRAPAIVYLTDCPDWTRLVAYDGELYGCFDARCAADKAPMGARAAVRVAPAPAIDTGTVVNVAPGRVDKPFMSVQPFFGQEYDPRRKGDKPTPAAGAWAEPADGAYRQGRVDLALLRCCGVAAGVEQAVNLHFLRIKIDRSDMVADMPAYTRSAVVNISKRWNGADEMNDQPARIVPVGAQPLNVRVLWVLQAGPRPHYRLNVDLGRSNMMPDGTGSWTEGDVVPTTVATVFPVGAFPAAHESGHADGLPDEYPERDLYGSYVAAPLVSNVPGDPFDSDKMAMMRSPMQMRARYYWHAAEWVRVASGIACKVVRGAEEYVIEAHPKAPARTYTYWPMAGHFDAAIGQGKFDLFLYRLGKDAHAQSVVPGEICDGMLVVSCKLKVKVPASHHAPAPGKKRPRAVAVLQNIDRELNKRLNRKWMVSGTLHHATLGPLRFEKCLVLFSARYAVEGAPFFKQELVDRARVHYQVELTEGGDTELKIAEAKSLVKVTELAAFQDHFVAMLGGNAATAPRSADCVPVQRIAELVLTGVVPARLGDDLADLPRAEVPDT